MCIEHSTLASDYDYVMNKCSNDLKKELPSDFMDELKACYNNDPNGSA